MDITKNFPFSKTQTTKFCANLREHVPAISALEQKVVELLLGSVWRTFTEMKSQK